MNVLMRALAVVLLVVGVYLLLWHGQAIAGGGNIIPFGHNAIGLGTNHTAHAIGGVVAFGAGVWLWFRATGMKIVRSAM